MLNTTQSHELGKQTGKGWGEEEGSWALDLIVLCLLAAGAV